MSAGGRWRANRKIFVTKCWHFRIHARENMFKRGNSKSKSAEVFNGRQAIQSNQKQTTFYSHLVKCRLAGEWIHREQKKRLNEWEVLLRKCRRQFHCNHISLFNSCPLSVSGCRHSWKIGACSCTEKERMRERGRWREKMQGKWETAECVMRLIWSREALPDTRLDSPSMSQSVHQLW